jgi:predicted metal-dependent HD superfamily phosphohydrolase
MPKQKGNVQTALKKLIGFLEVFATAAQHVQNPMKKNKPMEVHEWLAHVYSATSHGYHPAVHVLLIFTWFGHLA